MSIDSSIPSITVSKSQEELKELICDMITPTTSSNWKAVALKISLVAVILVASVASFYFFISTYAIIAVPISAAGSLYSLIGHVNNFANWILVN